MPSERLLDFDSSYIKGTNSSMDPSQLPLGYAWNTINCINVAGVISCRPGHRCIIKLPQGNLQGATIFRPKLGLEQIVIAIDGVIYVASYPFNKFSILTNVLFSSSAKQVFWTQATQSARRLTTDFASAIEVIEPKEVLFMQDGGITAPAFYDGSNSGHIRDNAFETPAGGAMEWVGDRLWVSVGNKVFASDIANPFSFREQTYLGGTSGFYFSRDVTALTRTPSIEFPQLLVYTDEDCSIIEANIRDRSLWPTTDGMQREILQVGCVSDRAITSHFGRLVWMSPAGIVFYDPATSRGWTSRSPLRDNEMLVSKNNLSSDLSLSAMGTFGQWLLTSLPVEDRYNKHTWILNNAAWETLSDEGGPTWSGYWLGTRPVEWVYGVIAGAERIYHVSKDSDGENRLWESFTPDRLDNGCPIMWAIETRGFFGLTGQAKKLPGTRCRFNWADIAMTATAEDLDVGVFVAPGVRGAYRQIMAKKISVEKGSLRFDSEITMSTEIFAYKPQSRILRTEDLARQTANLEDGSCPVESKDNDNNEESFQLLIVGHGPASLRWIRTFAVAAPEETFAGDSQACTDEPNFNIVRFDGESIRNDDLKEAEAIIAAKPLRYFTASKTVALSQNGFSAVGVGSSESFVSQEAADRVATRIATRDAEVQIMNASPPILSVGLT